MLCICLARLNDTVFAFTIGFSLSEVTEVNYFVARKEELDQIHEELSQGPGRRTVVVHGLGGMGKTQLAAAYAKRHRDDHSAVFWLNGRDETTLKQGFAKVAERILLYRPSVAYINNAVHSRDLDEAVQAVKRWLDEPKNDRWLIVYDNYDHPDLAGGGSSQPNRQMAESNTADGDMNVSSLYDIRPFLPDAHQGAILITTRSSTVKIGHCIALEKLRDIEDSLEILAHMSNRQGLKDGM